MINDEQAILFRFVTNRISPQIQYQKIIQWLNATHRSSSFRLDNRTDWLTFRWKTSRMFLIKLFPAYSSINVKHRPSFARLCKRLWSMAKYVNRVRLRRICPSKSSMAFFDTFNRRKLDNDSNPSSRVKKLFCSESSSNLTKYSKPWMTKEGNQSETLSSRQILTNVLPRSS